MADHYGSPPASSRMTAFCLSHILRIVFIDRFYLCGKGITLPRRSREVVASAIRLMRRPMGPSSVTSSTSSRIGAISPTPDGSGVGVK